MNDEEYRARVKKYVDEGCIPIPEDPQMAFNALCSDGGSLNPGSQTIDPGNGKQP
jgi:hypothetical protein